MCGISYASIVKQRVLLGQNLILPVPGDRKPHPTHFWLDQIGCIACTYQWLNTAASMPATGTPSAAGGGPGAPPPPGPGGMHCAVEV